MAAPTASTSPFDYRDAPVPVRDDIVAALGRLGAPVEVVAESHQPEVLREMVRRFASTDVGQRLEAADASDADVRRELRFHARIRFPRGASVAGFEHLLVRGAIDLWLPGPDGVEMRRWYEPTFAPAAELAAQKRGELVERFDELLRPAATGRKQ